MIERDLVSTRYYDCKWNIKDYGSYAEVSGYTTFVENVPNPSYSGYDPWPPYVGEVMPFSIENAQILGDQLVIPNTGEYQSGQIVLTLNGNRLQGSGSFYSAGVTVHYDIDLKREGLFGFFGTSTIAPIASLGFVVVFIVIIVTVLKPVRVPMTPSVTKVPPYNPTYVPSDVRTTGEPTPLPPPEVGLPQTGAGLYIPPPPPPGRPLPPKEHFSRSQEPPRCPIHGDAALVAHFKYAEGDPGSWYCPKCKGYPWGRS